MSIFLPIELTFWARYLYGKGRNPGKLHKLIRLIRTVIMFCQPVGWLWLGIDLTRRQQWYDTSLEARHCFNSGDAALRGRKQTSVQEADDFWGFLLKLVAFCVVFCIAVFVAFMLYMNAHPNTV